MQCKNYRVSLSFRIVFSNIVFDFESFYMYANTAIAQMLMLNGRHGNYAIDPVHVQTNIHTNNYRDEKLRFSKSFSSANTMSHSGHIAMEQSMRFAFLLVFLFHGNLHGSNWYEMIALFE